MRISRQRAPRRRLRSIPKRRRGCSAGFVTPIPKSRQDGGFDALTWRPVKLFMLQAIARPYFSFLLPALALWFFTRLGLLSADVALLIGVLIAIVMLFWGLWICEEHENDKFILNIREIVDVDKKPFGPESSRRAPLSAIQNIEFDVSFIEGMLGYGDVIITTAGGAGKFTFEHVPDPRGVQATINNYLSYFKRRETERNLKGTLDLLQQYHKLQIEHGELIGDNLMNNEAGCRTDRQPGRSAAGGRSARAGRARGGRAGAARSRPPGGDAFAPRARPHRIFPPPSSTIGDAMRRGLLTSLLLLLFALAMAVAASAPARVGWPRINRRSRWTYASAMRAHIASANGFR